MYLQLSDRNSMRWWMPIPSEIRDFFQIENGQTFLIKGLPGTGKTTLAFEMMKNLCKKDNGLYISTRTYPERLYSTHPWIKNVLPPKNIINGEYPMRMGYFFWSKIPVNSYWKVESGIIWYSVFVPFGKMSQHDIPDFICCNRISDRPSWTECVIWG